MPHIAAGTDTRRDAACQRWVEHFQGELPYLEALTLNRREAHCVREAIRMAFEAGWRAALEEAQQAPQQTPHPDPDPA